MGDGALGEGVGDGFVGDLGRKDVMDGEYWALTLLIVGETCEGRAEIHVEQIFDSELYGNGYCRVSDKFWIYHRQYCLCAVTGRSGRAVQTLFLCLLCSRSSINRIRVASSFSRTVIPACGSVFS